jgi:hypothetical protein
MMEHLFISMDGYIPEPSIYYKGEENFIIGVYLLNAKTISGFLRDNLVPLARSNFRKIKVVGSYNKLRRDSFMGVDTRKLYKKCNNKEITIGSPCLLCKKYLSSLRCKCSYRTLQCSLEIQL